MKGFLKKRPAPAGKFWDVMFAKHPYNVETIRQWLQVLFVVFLLVIGGAYYLVPDSAQKQGQLQSLELKKRQLSARLTQIKNEKKKLGGVNAPPLETDTAIFVTRSLGGHIRRARLAEGYMDISLPIQSLGKEFISPPSMAERIEFYRQAFGHSCGVRAIWPRIMLRIYVSAPSADKH